MEPVIDHVQITVGDFPAAVRFYDKLMPLLDFNPAKRVSAMIAAHDLEVVEYSHPLLAFAITSPRQAQRDEGVHRRRPGRFIILPFGPRPATK